nr:hypothetical protein [Allomuricauda sp.]
MIKIRILTFLIIVGFTGCGTSRLSEKQAMELAERYVLDHGYTDKEAKVDLFDIKPDIVEKMVPRKNALELRRNTLMPKAVFASRGLRRWTVGFKSNLDSTRYRIVRIYRNGKRIEMEHQDLKITFE